MIKRPYTIYSSLLKKLCKKFHKNPVEVLDILKADKEFDRDFIPTLEVEMGIEMGNSTHFYFSDLDFVNWLVGCYSKSDKSILESFQSLSGSLNTAVFHFPCSSKLYSFAFYIDDLFFRKDESGKITKARTATLTISTNLPKEFGCCASVDLNSDSGLDTFSFDLENEDIENFSTKNSFIWFCLKLVHCVGMYNGCFPECFKPGVPDDIRHPSNHKQKDGKRVSIIVSDKIKSQHESPTGHFRSGHFRLLSSPRFTNKRFQTVFVHSSFVGSGKSKTVLSMDQFDELNKQINHSTHN